MRAFWAVSRVAFYGLLVMLLVLIAANFLPDFRNRPAAGCYWASALFRYVECRGFPGSKVAGSILNMPVLGHFYMQVFFHEVQTGFELARQKPHLLARTIRLVAWQIGFVAWFVMGLIYPLLLEYLRLRAKPSPNRSEPPSPG